jgi:hypothetical protein
MVDQSEMKQWLERLMVKMDADSLEETRPREDSKVYCSKL